MPEIEIYTSSTCGYCKQAKKLLESKDVTYDETIFFRAVQTQAGL